MLEQLIAELEAMTGLHIVSDTKIADVRDAIDTWRSSK